MSVPDRQGTSPFSLETRLLVDASGRFVGRDVRWLESDSRAGVDRGEAFDISRLCIGINNGYYFG